MKVPILAAASGLAFSASVIVSPVFAQGRGERVDANGMPTTHSTPQEQAETADGESDANQPQTGANPRQERSLGGEKVFGILLYWLIHDGIVMKSWPFARRALSEGAKRYDRGSVTGILWPLPPPPIHCRLFTISSLREERSRVRVFRMNFAGDNWRWRRRWSVLSASIIT